MTDDDQLDERIRASLTRRAEAIRVDPDLAGLAKGAAPRQARAQRYPLVAVAVVLAALTATSVALGQGYTDSNLISRALNRTDKAEEPTTTTDAPDSTSAPDKPKGPRGPDRHKSTSTTATVPVPTPVPPPGAPVSPGLGGEAPDDGASPTPPPAPKESKPPCAPVDGAFDTISMDGYDVFVTELRNDGATRLLTFWRSAPGPDTCAERMTNSAGDLFEFDQPLASGDVSSSAVRWCGPRYEVVYGSSDDGLNWTFYLQTYDIRGTVAAMSEDHILPYVAPDDAETIDGLRRADCDVLADIV